MKRQIAILILALCISLPSIASEKANNSSDHELFNYFDDIDNLLLEKIFPILKQTDKNVIRSSLVAIPSNTFDNYSSIYTLFLTSLNREQVLKFSGNCKLHQIILSVCGIDYAKKRIIEKIGSGENIQVWIGYLASDAYSIREKISYCRAKQTNNLKLTEIKNEDLERKCLTKK